MSLAALALTRVQGRRRIPSEHILSLGHSFEVLWVNAPAIPAQVVDDKALGNGSNE